MSVYMSIARKLGFAALLIAFLTGCKSASNAEVLRQLKAQDKKESVQKEPSYVGMFRQLRALEKEEAEKDVSTEAGRYLEKLRQEIEQKKDSLDDFFQKNTVVYNQWSEIDFDAVPEKKVAVPEDFFQRIRDNRGSEIKYKEGFEKIVHDEARKLGYDRKKIAELMPKDALMLAVDIVGKRITYIDVDNDKEFIKKHGEHLPIDYYFKLGQGDCDKYATAVMAVFDLIKKINPHLENVYVSSGKLGGNSVPHEWNSVMFMTSGKLIITHIDPTFYDHSKPLEVKVGWHIPKMPEGFLAKFFLECKAYECSYTWYDALYNKTEDPEKKGEILYNMIRCVAFLNDERKMDSVVERYLQLRESGELKDGSMDATMFYWALGRSRRGNIAQRCKDEILKRFPKSDSAKFIREHPYITARFK